MRLISFYTWTAFNLLGTLNYKRKLNSIKKRGNQKEIDDYVDTLVSSWSRLVLNKCKIKVLVKGNENLPEGACLFVANHQGNFDFFAMMGYINKPIGFVAKKEIEKIPIAADWMREMHCVFMDRSNVREAVKAIEEGVENLKNGYSMVIFPEGTRSKGKEMGEFKKGSLKLGLKAGVPIVPVSLEGSYKVFEANEGKKITPCEIKVVIGKPIYTANMSREEQKNITNEVRNIIFNTVNEMKNEN